MIRVTSGEWRGRGLSTPAHFKTRPTQAKLRQALFNSIQMSIPGARILDLFSGGGTLAFEALSRGAETAVLVENDREALKCIEKNIKEFKCESTVQVIAGPMKSVVAQIEMTGPFDLIFADPPYADEWELWLLESLNFEKLLNVGGLFILEWGTRKSKITELKDQYGLLNKVRERVYGESLLTTFERGEN
jgi:16S rRNA (guanine966-N2)-methyltransferase